MLGGVDGVITSFAIVAGSDAGNLSAKALAVVGASSLAADAISMGVSEFLSSHAERAQAARRAQATRAPATPDGHRHDLSRVSGSAPLILGVVCFFAFIACGTVPLVVYLFTGLLACVASSLLELMILGALRSRATSEPVLVGVAQTATLGAIAGAIAYGIGAAAGSIDFNESEG